MKWWKIASLLVLGVALAIFALIGIQQVFRGTPARAVYAFGDPTGPPEVGSPEFVRNLALLTHTSLETGHQAEILLNGDGTFPRLWEDLRSARESIVRSEERRVGKE